MSCAPRDVRGRIQNCAAEIDVLGELILRLFEGFAMERVESTATCSQPNVLRIAHPENARLQLIDRQAPGFARLVQFLLGAAQPVAALGEGALEGFDVGGVGGVGGLEGAGELLGGLAAAAHAFVEVEHEVAESDAVEALDDGVDGGALFGDEEG